ncbi:MAG: polymorphic toxin-type HINT domain-containing protein, partial [Planctomycetaceae bacterium]
YIGPYLSDTYWRFRYHLAQEDAQWTAQRAPVYVAFVTAVAAQQRLYDETTATAARAGRDTRAAAQLVFDLGKNAATGVRAEATLNATTAAVIANGVSDDDRESAITNATAAKEHAIIDADYAFEISSKDAAAVAARISAINAALTAYSTAVQTAYAAEIRTGAAAERDKTIAIAAAERDFTITVAGNQLILSTATAGAVLTLSIAESDSAKAQAQTVAVLAAADWISIARTYRSEMIDLVARDGSVYAVQRTAAVDAWFQWVAVVAPQRRDSDIATAAARRDSEVSTATADFVKDVAVATAGYVITVAGAQAAYSASVSTANATYALQEFIAIVAESSVVTSAVTTWESWKSIDGSILAGTRADDEPLDFYGLTDSMVDREMTLGTWGDMGYFRGLVSSMFVTDAEIAKQKREAQGYHGTWYQQFILGSAIDSGTFNEYIGGATTTVLGEEWLASAEDWKIIGGTAAFSVVLVIAVWTSPVWVPAAGAGIAELGLVGGGMALAEGALVSGVASFVGQYREYGSVNGRVVMEEALIGGAISVATAGVFSAGGSVFKAGVGKVLTRVGQKFPTSRFAGEAGELLINRYSSNATKVVVGGIAGYGLARGAYDTWNGDAEAGADLLVTAIGALVSLRRGNWCFVGDTPVAVAHVSSTVAYASLRDAEAPAAEAEEPAESQVVWLLAGGVAIAVGLQFVASDEKRKRRRFAGALFPDDEMHADESDERPVQAPTAEDLEFVCGKLMQPAPEKPLLIESHCLPSTEENSGTWSEVQGAASMKRRIRRGTDGRTSRGVQRPSFLRVMAGLLLITGCLLLGKGLTDSGRTPTPSFASASFPGISFNGHGDASLNLGRVGKSAAAPQKTLQTVPIADIQPGMRVLADNPLHEGLQTVDLEVDPATWRTLRIHMVKEDGSRLDIVLLRSLDWIREYAAVAGTTIELDLEELGAHGEAFVESISPCPSILPGEGQVVTGRFVHSSANVIDVHVSGESHPIGTTANHPFFSDDRNAFIPAGELRIGERLRREDGSTAEVTKLNLRFGELPVFNLEVNVEHVYHVGETGLLVHNSYPTASGGTGVNYNRETGHGVYVLIDDDGVVRYVGRGDAPTRIEAHRESGSGKEDLIPITLFDNNLPERKAISLEHELINVYGGAKSINGGTQLRNKRQEIAEMNARFLDLEFEAEDELLIEALQRIWANGGK